MGTGGASRRGANLAGRPPGKMKISAYPLIHLLVRPFFYLAASCGTSRFSLLTPGLGRRLGCACGHGGWRQWEAIDLSMVAARLFAAAQ
jgi:hypothetical protein